MADGVHRRCLMCPKEFPARIHAGREQVFCGVQCRAAFHKIARQWGELQFWQGNTSLESMMASLATYTLNGRLIPR